MSCVEGRTLKDRIYKSEKHAAPLPLNEAIDTAIQIGEGLALAHENGIVHRDVKSANIMLTDKSQVKIMDFGLAKLKGQTKVTREGTTMGTVAYMSPEQALGKDVDQRTDIWSMGVVLYEMLCGQLPFKGEYDQSIMYAIMNENPEPVTALRSGIPMELERIIQKALEKNREERYQSAKDILVDLKRLKRDTESGEVAAKPGISKRPAAHWLRLLAVFGIVLIILAAALLFKPWRSDNVSLTAANSIVVLPCKVYGAKDAEYLSEAIPGSLSTLLVNVEGLEIKAPITNSEFESIRGDLGKAAALYQVQRFIQPFVTTESDQMTLNVELLDSKTRRFLVEQGVSRPPRQLS